MADSTQTDLADAIAYAEGFGVPGALPTVNNNPGDLTSGGQLNVYPDSTAGYTALQGQLDRIAAGQSKYYNPSMSISQIGQVYANGDPNWASNVADYLGVSPDTPFSSVYSQSGTSPAPGGTSAPSSASGTSSGSPSWLCNASQLDPTGILASFCDPTGATVGSSSTSGDTKTTAVVIILGLILIAAGVFGFDKVREIAVSGGKKAAEGLALA
jgi:hypothetical protein